MPRKLESPVCATTEVGQFMMLWTAPSHPSPVPMWHTLHKKSPCSSCLGTLHPTGISQLLALYLVKPFHLLTIAKLHPEDPGVNAIHRLLAPVGAGQGEIGPRLSKQQSS